MLFGVCVYEYLTYHNKQSNYIMKNMLYDYFFIIQDKVYDIFQPIFSDDLMVGFLSANYYNDKVIIELAYILPQYRGQGLFCKYLKVLDEYFNDKELWLDLPNRFAIQSLLDNGLAFKIGNRFVVSDYFLSFNHGDEKVASKLYDLKYCCIVNIRRECVSPLLDVDAYRFDACRDLPYDYYRRVKGLVEDL